MARKKPYRAIAIRLAAAGVILVALSVGAYWLALHDQGLSSLSADWGTFGDFVGGIAGTLIALATLVALAITLDLQAQELVKTSDALERQVQAAADQLKLTRALELRKIRPLLKVEWFRTKSHDLELRMKNVGLGAAIVDSMELHSHSMLMGTLERDDQKSRAAFASAFEMVLNSFLKGQFDVETQPLGDLTRALAANEYQWITRLSFFQSDQVQPALDSLMEDFEIVIHFRSIAGERLSTRNQFELAEL